MKFNSVILLIDSMISSNDLDDILQLPTLSLSRFIPKVWDALHLHGLNDFSQSGCKIAMYSSVGWRLIPIYLSVD